MQKINKLIRRYLMLAILSMTITFILFSIKKFIRPKPYESKEIPVGDSYIVTLTDEGL